MRMSGNHFQHSSGTEAGSRPRRVRETMQQESVDHLFGGTLEARPTSSWPRSRFSRAPLATVHCGTTQKMVFMTLMDVSQIQDACDKCSISWVALQSGPDSWPQAQREVNLRCCTDAEVWVRELDGQQILQCSQNFSPSSL